MTDIAPIKGLIELQDDFTSQLGLAEAALGNFTKKNQESLKAVGIAAGLVAGAVTAIAVAAVELGKRGADVNDVNDTLIHFAGGAREADAAMEALRAGTKGTIDNFVLAKDAAHLLSAGVKLTTDDFSTLGQAAFVLQNRGLGGTKEQLELVSDALVTGRTRSLQMALGVVDAGDAEENYAKKLGVTKDQLSDSGKVEAHRIEVMRILKAAVKDAGDQQVDFGERFEVASASVQNWLDDLGSAIAKSPVLAAGLDAITEAVTSAFGGDKSDSVKYFTELIEDGAVKVIDFAQVMIMGARVVSGAWNAIKTIVLGVETIIVGAIASIVQNIAYAAKVGEKLHLVSPVAAAEVQGVADNLKNMTLALADQTAEAAKGIFGHTEFSTSMDNLSEKLTKIKTSMLTVAAETRNKKDADKEATVESTKLAVSQDELNKKMIDGTKVAAALAKSTSELSAMWADYYAEVAKNSLTTAQAQQFDIEATFQKNVASLDKLDPLYKQKYELFRKIADEQLGAISADWDSVKDTSIEGMQEMADKALATLEMMENGSLHFTREALEAQRQKWQDLSNAARGWGKEASTAVQDVASVIKILDAAWVTDSDIAAATINKTTVMVRTLAGELISLAEAQKRQQQGGSYDVTSANFETALKNYLTNGGFNPTAAGVREYRDPRKLAKQGYSFAEIIKYAYDGQQQGPLPPPQGPRIPGFAEGGMVMVGERGPEAVRLPFGSAVYPHGTMPGGNVTNIFHVNGTASDVARQISEQIMFRLKMTRQFSA